MLLLLLLSLLDIVNRDHILGPVLILYDLIAHLLQLGRVNLYLRLLLQSRLLLNKDLGLLRQERLDLISLRLLLHLLLDKWKVI